MEHDTAVETPHTKQRTGCQGLIALHSAVRRRHRNRIVRLVGVIARCAAGSGLVSWGNQLGAHHGNVPRTRPANFPGSSQLGDVESCLVPSRNALSLLRRRRYANRASGNAITVRSVSAQRLRAVRPRCVDAGLFLAPAPVAVHGEVYDECLVKSHTRATGVGSAGDSGSWTR